MMFRVVLLRLAPRLIAAGRVARAVGSTPPPSPPCAPGGIPRPATITLDQNTVLQAMFDIVFLFLQRYFITGLTEGATKG